MYIVILEQKSNTGKANSDSEVVRFGDEALVRYERDSVFIRFLCETSLRLVSGKKKKGVHRIHIDVGTYCHRVLSFKEFFLEPVPSLELSSSSISKLRLQLRMI